VNFNIFAPFPGWGIFDHIAHRSLIQVNTVTMPCYNESTQSGQNIFRINYALDLASNGHPPGCVTAPGSVTHGNSDNHNHKMQ